jgi:alkanesulfonate monooxygenase SsuD/methylene tetrahydromethanopterin reductase-like flavin-dependent oxidoreductase (luciferase family)
MRFGIAYNIDYHEEIHGSPADYFEEILQQVELLEEVGFDTVWFSEHHTSGYSFGNPCVIAAAAAMRTSRIRLGIGVSLLPLHNPIALAEQYGMLDVLSRGRLEFGIGRGYSKKEYAWFKVPFEESHSRYHEATDFLIKSWTSNGPISFHGEHFDVDDYHYFPKPVQNPFPAIYASAGGTRDSFRWAGAKGLHLGTPLFLPSLDDVADNIAYYRETLAEHGHDPASREVCAITQMYCAPTDEEAVRDGATFATNYYRFFSDLVGGQAFFSDARGEDLNRDDRVFLGSPANLVERMAAMRDRFGLDLMLMEVAQGKAPPAKVRECLRLFGTQVIPHFRDEPVPAMARVAEG